MPNDTKQSGSSGTPEKGRAGQAIDPGNRPDKHPIEDRYNTHDASFRRHYQLNLREDPQSYDFYAPAYRLGYELAEERSSSSWETVRDEAKTHWQSHHPGTWEQVADAVLYGWREQRNPDELRVHH